MSIRHGDDRPPQGGFIMSTDDLRSICLNMESMHLILF